MKKLLPYCLIALLTISLVACKNGSDSSGGGSGTTTPATNTTPLEGTWVNTTIGQTYAFAGSGIAVTQTGLPNPSDPSLSDVSMTIGGTFRLDSGKIYMTPKTIVVAVAGTPMSQTDQDAYLSGNPMSLNTEMLLATYAVNGNTLTLTDTSTSSTISFTKQ